MRTIWWAAIAAIAIAGCSEGGDDVATATTGGDGTLNGCTAATAEDHTADTANVIVKFGTAGPGTLYAPACVKIKVGQTVEWQGNFSGHPLVGGIADDNGNKTPDAASPIGTTDMGTSKPVTFGAAGAFGYYCDIHGIAGMRGAVYVE